MKRGSSGSASLQRADAHSVVKPTRPLSGVAQALPITFSCPYAPGSPSCSVRRARSTKLRRTGRPQRRQEFQVDVTRLGLFGRDGEDVAPVVHEERIDHLVCAVLVAQCGETLVAPGLVHAQVGAVFAAGNERAVFQVAVVVNPQLVGVEDPLGVPGHLLAGVLRHHRALSELAEQAPELFAVPPPVEAAVAAVIGIGLQIGPDVRAEMGIDIQMGVLDAPA